MKKNYILFYFFLIVTLLTPTLMWSKGNNFNHQNPFVSAIPNTVPSSIYGDFTATGNSVLCQNNGNNQCDNNYNGYLYDSNLMYKRDVAVASIPLNSATATLTLPAGIAGSEILWAGLYWQGHIAGQDAANRTTDTMIANRNQVKAKWPDGTFSDITADKVWYHDIWGNGTGDSGGYRSFYQGFKDVTALLKSHLILGTTQPITIGNIKSTSGSDWASYFALKNGIDFNGIKFGFWGNWSLVIVYNYPANSIPPGTPQKNVKVSHGFDAMIPLPVNGYETFNVELPITNFYTPAAGAVNSKMLFYASGGEKKIERDAFYIQNANNANAYTKVSNLLNPANNPFNGTVSQNGIALNATIGYYPGLDLDTYDISAYMKNKQTSTSLKLEATFSNGNGDQSTPGVLAFSTDIYKPSLCYVENIFRGTKNISGQDVQVNADENLTVRVYVKNTGNEVAEKVQILHKFDSSFPYVAQSTNYNNSNPTYEIVIPPTTYTRIAASDSSNNDLFEYNSTSLLSKINLGIGATSSSGGTFSDNNQTTAVFEYNATLKSTQSYSNTYQVAYVNSVLGIDYSNNPVQISSCDGSTNSFYGYSFTKQGNVDAVDNYAMNGYTPAMGLQTKIANKSNYTVDALWLGLGTTPTNYIGSNQGGGIPITISLSDSTCSTDESLSVTGTPVEAIIPKGDFKGTSSAFTIINKAKKNAKLRFRFIDWNNLATPKALKCFKSSQFSSLEKVPACFASDVQIEEAFGTAIANQCTTTGARPACQPNSYNNNNVPSPPYDNIYGCFNCLADALNGAQCSTDNFAIRPNDFNSTITANQIFIADQNASITFLANQFNGTGTTDYNEIVNTSFKVDVNISDSTKTCTAPSIQFTSAIVFANGTVTNNYALPNVGDFNLTMHEIPGSEFALVDADDTPDAQRYISPFVRQIKVVPNSFSIDGNFTNGSNGFTYLSNFEAYPTATDRNVSALLDLNISARSATNAITTNYTALCYAKDGNITINTATAGNTLTGLSKLLWYDNLHDLNGSVSLANISNYTMALDNTQFNSTEANGTAQVKYRINFDRNSTKSVQPFVFNVTDVNTSNEDNRTGTKALTDQNVTYYYGRVYSTDYRGPITGIPTTIRYEVYCNGCIRANFNITGTQSPTSLTWYQNPLHVNSDGNVTTFSSIGTTLINNANTANSGVIATGTERNTLTNATAPYTDRIQMAPSSWLIYNAFNANALTNDFNVEFVRSGDWAGQGNLGKTVDVNSSVRTNRRMEW